MKKYIVRDGDTLSSVSDVTGVKTNLLMAANPHITDPGHLLPGQVLSIPELGKTVTTTGRAAVPSGPQPQAPITVTPPQAQPMQHLPAVQVIAESPSSPSYQAPSMPTGGDDGQAIAGMPSYFGFVWPHVVSVGDTWQTLCVTYGTTMDQIQCLNPTVWRRPLYQGDIVYIPYLPKSIRRRQRQQQQQLMNAPNPPWGVEPGTPGFQQQPPYPYTPGPYEAVNSYAAPYPTQYPAPYPEIPSRWPLPLQSTPDWYANWEGSSLWESEPNLDGTVDTGQRTDTRPAGGTPDGNGTR